MKYNVQRCCKLLFFFSSIVHLSEYCKFVKLLPLRIFNLFSEKKVQN